MLGSILSTIGSVASGIFGAKYNAKKQEEFAKNSLGWKLEDAERHGVSKYFAVGAPTSNFAPVNVGGDFSALQNIDKQMGQSGPAGTTTGKLSGISAQIAAAQLDGIRIDNDIKRAELASKINVATQPGAQHVQDRDVSYGPEGFKAKVEKAPAGYLPNKEFGVSPEVSMYRTKEGWAPQIPQQLQEAFESDMLSRWQWNLRNKILPGMSQSFMETYGTPPFKAPPGEYWDFDPLRGEYRLRQKSDRPYYSRD